jgi:hypothetical protein
LSWEVHEGNPTGILVERLAVSEQGRGGSLERIAKLPVNAREYVDAKAPKGKSAGYRVRAFNEAGESAYSNVARTGVP